MATILIVDDLPMNRRLLVTLLEHHGHRLLEASDGHEGLAVARAERPDLVITDVLMPVMDGYQFARQLRLDPAIRHTPLVFSTAHYGEREARELARSIGVAHVITKPIQATDLVRLVDDVMAGTTSAIERDVAPSATAFDREHLRLVTDKLSEKVGDLRAANARLRALVNIGLELASERDSDRLLGRVCEAARELFGATYLTLGILDKQNHTVQHVITSGAAPATWIASGDVLSGILRTVVVERRAVRGDNPGGDPSALHLPAQHPPVHGYLAAPIASPGHVYGWLCLVSNDGPGFTEADDDLVLALGGQVGRIYELADENAQRRRAESAVRIERDRAQLYLDTSQVIMLGLDLDGRITQINHKGCDLLGWNERELLGHEWIVTCVPPSEHASLRRKFEALAAGDMSIVENNVLTRSGGTRLIEWRNAIVRDAAGVATGTLSSGTDITERNRALDALRIAEERMRFTLEAAGVGIWDMDFTTGALVWSEILEAQYGLQPQTFGGTFEAFVDLVHPQDRDAVLATMAEANRSGADFSITHRTVWPDGTVRWLNGAGRIRFDGDGVPARGVGISLDITERRLLEEQYQQAQKMEAVGRLAGGVAHDFNNLLTVILGYCDLLLEDLDSEDPRVGIAEIQKAGERAAGLTRQLLAFSRKQIVELRLLDLNEVVSDMRAMLGRLIEEDVDVLLEPGGGSMPIRADRGQLEQVVMNLALNARDAMPDGGSLTIETADIELDALYAETHPSAVPGRYVVLTVTDTGTGMTPQVQARLFEPFFTTKEPGTGTGLGLATVQGIIARSGGSIGIYSEVGMGTSVKVYLPRADSDETDVERPPVTKPRSAGSETLLVVEDAEGVRELARKLLLRLGYVVLVAATADEALRLFAENPSISVLLTDVVMPGVSGPELTRQMVDQRPDLKVIYMSGYTEQAIVRHGVLNPGIAFLHKPFTADSLQRKIRETLDA